MTQLTSTNDTLNALTSVIPDAQAFVIPHLGNAPIEQRMAALKAMANLSGLRLPDTRLPEGTALLPVGEESKRKMQCELNALPFLRPALDAYAARLRAEDPKDSPASLRDVAMAEATGGLFSPKETNAAHAIGYTRDGFAHIAAFMKPSSIRNGFSENLLALPNALRAQVFNHWARIAPRGEDVVIRTFRGGTKGRIIRAVTSDSHSLQTGDDLAVTGALYNLGVDCRVRITREAGGRISEVEVIWPMMDRQLVVGDIAYGGIRITNSETKASSLRVEAFLLRVLCYNFTTAFTEDVDARELKLNHVGDLTRRLPRLVEEARQRIEPFVKMFGDAYKDGMPAGLPTRGDVLERAEKVFDISPTVLKLAGSMWDADGLKSAGDTRAGFVNALTRASQELSITEAAEVERIAGKVVAGGWAALAD